MTPESLRERHAEPRIEGVRGARRQGGGGRDGEAQRRPRQAAGVRGEQRVVERRAVEHRAAVLARGVEHVLGEMGIDDHASSRRYADKA